MFDRILLPSLLALVLSTVTSSATPIELGQTLALRDNKYNLKCSNAPGIVAGNMVTPDDVVLGTDLPPSGSNQQWMKYLWCTVNTRTYTFFDFGPMDPAPETYGYFNIYGALNQAKARVHSELLTKGDVGLNKDGLDVGFNPLVPNTNVSVFMHDSVGKLTYGIMEAALTGLITAVQNYDKGNYPMVYQVNDGDWGEVGHGYVGLVPGDNVQTWRTDKCTYSITPDGGNKACSEVR